MTVYRYPRGASIGISLDFTATGSETIDQATVTAALRLAGSDMPVAQFSIERRGGKGWILRLSRDVTSVLDRGHYLADIQTTVDGAVTASIVEIEIVRGSASGMQIGEAFITSQDGDTDLDNTHLRARSLKIASGGGVSDYEDDSDIAFAVVGDDDKILYHVMKDRELRAGAISAERTVAFGGYQLEEYEDDGSNGPLVIVGVDGKIIPGLGGDDASAELVAARGSRDSLDARLSTALTTYGAPRQAIHGEWLLRETRHAIGMIEAGYTYQLPMLWIGDSWTDNERYWLEPLTDQLIAQFGDGGAGFTGLAWNAAQGQTTAQAHKNARSEVTVAYTAGITPVWNGTPTPDMGYVTVPAGEKLTIAIPAGNSSATVFFIGDTGASTRYRWDGGAWTALDLSGSGLLTAALTGAPAGAATLEVEGVAGSSKIGGLRFKGDGAGVIVDKIGVSGSNLTQWTAVNAAQWQAGIAALAPKFVSILFGTNDQVASTPSGFAANVATMINRVRAAVPLADILIGVPAENALGRATPMTDYAAAAYQVAVEKSCAFIDFQYFFGSDIAEYDWSSARQWIGADGAHPSVDNGGLVITSALHRLITTF